MRRDIENMERVERLELDSTVFGFSVAKILPNRLDIKELGEILSRLKGEGVRLVFWSSDPEDRGSQQAARHHQGFLADKKVTFVADVAGAAHRPDETGWDIEEYEDAWPSAELEQLAMEVGRHSRFGADPRMPIDKYCDLYKLWIRNSVNGTVADAVLVVRQAGKVVGMATVGCREGRAFIGLFAVDSDMRGKQIGVSLACAAKAWARRRGWKRAQVVTQKANRAACRLYEKCGYKVERMEYFYHFWL